MTSYRVEVQGASGGWRTIATGTRAVTGTLGAWSTAGQPPGSYTLRLTVDDAQLGSASDTITVTIQ